MSEEFLVRNCAPTLAGIKTASLFVYSFHSKASLMDSIRKYNSILVPKGIRIIPLRVSGQTALIYVYRPALLQRDFSRDTAAKLLRHYHYFPENCGRSIRLLTANLKRQKSFPHEIGLFLGYPPEDVFGFIANGGKCCKYVGCWKVYGDVEVARSRFSQYRLCTRIYCERLQRGCTLARLADAHLPDSESDFGSENEISSCKILSFDI